MGSTDDSLIVPIIRILGNIFLGSSEQIKKIMSFESIFPRMTDLLNSDKKVIRVETCWALSNFAAGNSQQVDFFLTHERMIGILLLLLETDISDVKK